MSRKKVLLVVLAVFGFFIFASVIFIIGIKAAFDSKPIIKDNSVLRLSLSGAITERFSPDAFGREFEGAAVQLHDIRKALHMASADKRIKGVYLRLSAPELGWAKAQEIKRLISKFKDTGKFVTAFLNYCDEKSYYMALAADEIYLMRNSFATINGFSVEIPFIKRAVNKLGVEVEVVSAGKYKSAGDMFTRKSMSAAHREATEALLSDVYEHFLQTVSQTRDIKREALAALLERGIYQAEALRGTGLIDGLKYGTEVSELIKAKVYGMEVAEVADKKLRMVSINNYAKLSPDDVGLGGKEKIALIYATGAIMSGQSGHDPINGRTLGAQSIIRMLLAARDNRGVKAVVLRVDSPGGSGQASDEIWAAIENVREKKPVVVSMSDVAASGGYWISMNCDGIVAEALTITGSIGVVSMLFDLSEAYEAVGIDWETLKTGPGADFPTDKRPLSPREWEQFKQLNRDFYQVFVQKVADGRGKSWDQVHAIAQGRIWTGARALKYGLVDTLGGLDTALGMAKEKAGIAADVSTRWQVYPQPKGFLESIMDKFSIRVAQSWLSENDTVSLLRQLSPATRGALRKLALFQLIRNGEVLAFAPAVPVVQ